VNERIERLRNRSIQSEPEVFAERALLVTEAYKQTEAFSPPMRRALVLKYLLEHMTVVINEDELIVGEKTTEYRGSPLYPEQYCMTLEELESIEKREHAPFKVGGETRRVLSDRVIPYWKNNIQSPGTRESRREGLDQRAPGTQEGCGRGVEERRFLGS